jgi:formylglycine-generating enzyme required for sulfatase activity
VDLGPAFCQFHVEPLNEKQVAEFVDHWYRAVCRKLEGPGEAAENKAAGLIRSLMKLLQEPEYRIGRLRELPANPLMLTILCVVHHQDRNLPHRRADLYAKCVRVLVEHWRKEVLENQGVAGFDPEAAEGVLSSLAWWLHEQENRTSQTVEELGAAAGKALADLAPGAKLGRDGVEFIKRMREGAFVDQCLDEARYAVLEPFIKALREEGVKPEQQLDILRRVRQFDHPGLIEVCRKLARSDHAELASLARVVLQRAGIELERPVIEVVGAGLEMRADPHTGIAFVTIPAGEFDMGAATSRWDDERPVHRVRLSSSFLLAKYPVNNQEYQGFLEANSGIKPPEYWNNSQFNDPQQPIVGVSWDDAQAFCQWAGCRLPTEAEWEYACRAGNQGEFCFGDAESELEQYAWYDKNSGGKTQPVGQKRPNQWGLYDVHGNVLEWCQDWKGKYPDGPVTDPKGPNKGEFRVLRGGCWIRPASRSFWPRSSWISYLGFRVILAPRSGASGE